ncbi:putative signal transducing protein [Dethiobacter alkaliphilus]|nr:DUF2007 domain-containing protein [Dethiobacter alkaliphilus]
MFCPKCGKEHEEIKACPDCYTSLVEKADNLRTKQDAEGEYVELVTVFVPGDTGELMLAKSILEDAGIRYLAKGERVQKWGFNAVTGPVEVQVAAQDADAARELLENLK